MSKHDPRVDAYIARSADFARPILNRIRKLVHAACPAVTEAIKWGAPFYEHKGILVATPAFKQHCALIFWKGKLIFGKHDQRKKLSRITSTTDLPGDKILAGYLRKALALNEAGVKTPRLKPEKKPKLVVPDYFLAALEKSKKSLATFKKLSPSCQREYVEWIVEAKREETRVKRLQTAMAWLAAGKARNWKYQ
jgi:uncharacterized protein YdeI (YjbR/CyaY-like superfamily)